MPGDTIRQLAEITDAALFERILTSVLRSATPSWYANLSHQGVNTEGKTVKAPLDNIGWQQIDGESMVVAAAHTTTSRDDLADKWLHDPATVTPRKKGGKPTQPAGDLVKAIGEIKKLRLQYNNLQAVLALTCNREEPAKVRVEAQALAEAADIKLDVWSASRIAQYLDTTAEGQAIRYEYLGVPAYLLSKAELLRAGKLSVDSHPLRSAYESMIERTTEIQSAEHVFLSGASGMGKTTLCVTLLQSVLLAGQAGLILNDQTVRDATSIEEAIDIELRRYLPHLQPQAGAKALALCSEAQPCILVVEDINQAGNTLGLLSKLAGWALQSTAETGTVGRRNWRLLCPVWPRFLAGFDRSRDLFAAGFVQTIGTYSQKEALEALKRRAEAEGISLTDLVAEAIAGALGRDPLLIGLYQFAGSGLAQDVISEYVSREYDTVALSSGLIRTDIEDAVKTLAFRMLQKRRLGPTWREVRSWLGQDDRDTLRALVSRGSIIRLTSISGDETIEFRHDRILHALLATGIASEIATNADHEALLDPYFAEYVGTAAVQISLPSEALKRLMLTSPLVAFFAFKDATSKNAEYVEIAASAIEDWLSIPENKSPTYFSRRMLALQILAEVDSPLVLRLTDCFPKGDHRKPLYEARFRNGDTAAGLKWLTEHSFETNFAGRQELVSYVHGQLGVKLTAALADILGSSTPTQDSLRGALYLAGYLGDAALAPAVSAAWAFASPGREDMEAFLWAAAQVCGADAEATLKPICDAWAALPEPEDYVPGQYTRSSLAAHGLSWKFRDHPPCAALPYFVQRANDDDALRWPITFMLRGVDHPIAVQHEAEYLAAQSRQHEGKGFVDHFVKNEWRNQWKYFGRSMSKASKAHLLALATDLQNDSHLRKQAFSLWEVSIASDDLAIVKAASAGDIFHDTAVWARIRRNDPSVIPDLVEKIKLKPESWWHAATYLWSDALMTLLEESLEKISSEVVDEGENDGRWFFPELLLRIEPSMAERMLLKYWEGLSLHRSFVQTALFIATPDLIFRASEIIEKYAEPKQFFENFGITTRIGVEGRPGLTREEQLEALTPYLGLISAHDLHDLWEACNERNWKRYRREYLDPLLPIAGSAVTSRIRVEPPFDMSDLDNALNGQRSFEWRWLEMAQQFGGEREELLKALLGWLQKKSSIASLEIAGHIYSTHATRTELVAFEEVAASILDCAATVKKVRFDVFHRTLM